MRDDRLPKFPRTPHFSEVSSATSDDVIATKEEVVSSFEKARTFVVEEKLDGANVRILFDGETEPVVGNREHILKKGYLKNTPAKVQFRPLWNWIYDHKKNFQHLTKILGVVPVVYGEWLYAKHTIFYDRLPTLLAPFDLYFDQKFLDPFRTREILLECGFIPPPQTEQDSLLSVVSSWSSNQIREGLYIKLGDGSSTIARFKKVREGFTPRSDFNESTLVRNVIQSDPA